MRELNETHNPTLASWVVSANQGDTDFPIQNLPFGVFRRKGSSEPFRGGVAIGDQIVDLPRIAASCLVSDQAKQAAEAGGMKNLNALMALGPSAWSALRLALSRLLRDGAAGQALVGSCLVPMNDVEYDLPAHIGDYTDFYTSVHHATNIGKQFRPNNPLLQNYKWVPIAYHGRASSIGVSGQSFRRPLGQVKDAETTTPVLTPTRSLDFELELGIFVGMGNRPGDPIPITDAEEHVFGICLLNDWSARDLQGWEYQPLGPFLSKNFATTISPWIVTLEALVPFRLPFTRETADPQPLPYLDSTLNRASGAIDIRLQVGLLTVGMQAAGAHADYIAETSYHHAYWTMAQMVTHHSVNGCDLRPGDLLGTGTLSGPGTNQAGALIELTAGGKRPVHLSSGEKRIFLEDGDSVVLRGWCERPGATRIGFGECWGTLLPARL
ncbi:fumarylacetoacetase [Ottowia thiooxydans]|uniref:fumarylacetoacetase n=1 Tax=Ottowia thiooxydans TaxID=219182 RepID=UPI00041C1766|nr:fumarylacetoacetase [Ottowia thiooxydans]